MKRKLRARMVSLWRHEAAAVTVAVSSALAPLSSEVTPTRVYEQKWMLDRNFL